MKTKLEIVNEVVEHFKTNPRSVDRFDTYTLGCRYNGPNGEHCAFAIFVKPDLQHKLNAFEGKSATTILRELGISILKEKYQIKDDWFWTEIQSLHDVESNWIKTENGNELSERGKISVADIIDYASR